MIRLKYFVLLVCLGGLMACNQKKETVEDNQVQVETVSEVEVPMFSDQRFQKDIEKYDAFMNKALVMYENDEFNSEEGKLKEERFEKDLKKYLDKMNRDLKDAEEKELQKFQDYIEAKQNEMERTIKSSLEE